MINRSSPITIANEKVSIVYVCGLLGISVDTIHGDASSKLYCPFGNLWHSDFGRTKAFKVFLSSNSGYCWACSALYTPVTLWSMHSGMDHKEAAEDLLTRIEYRGLDWHMELDEILEYEPTVDSNSLAMALKTYCATLAPDWEMIQLNKEVAPKLTKCLDLLEHVRTEEQARKWLDTCKQYMRSILISSE